MVMSTMDSTDDATLLLGAVRWLVATSAADAEDIDRAAAVLVAALLDLTAYQRGENDPRRQRTLKLAQRIQRAKAAGVPVAELAERFGRSRRSIYYLLSAKTSLHTSPLESPPVLKRRRTRNA
jgi:hypothetical protein